jgi:hypothetical protein
MQMQMHLGLPTIHHCGPEQRRSTAPVQLKSSLRDALIATGMLQARFRRPKVASPTEAKGVPSAVRLLICLKIAKKTPVLNA